jgi:hypothetical protein
VRGDLLTPAALAELLAAITVSLLDQIRAAYYRHCLITSGERQTRSSGFAEEFWSYLEGKIMGTDSLAKTSMLRKEKTIGHSDFRYLPGIVAILILLLPTLWLSSVIALTMLWYGVMCWLYEFRPVKFLFDKLDLLVKRLGLRWLKVGETAPIYIHLSGWE